MVAAAVKAGLTGAVQQRLNLGAVAHQRRVAERTEQVVGIAQLGPGAQVGGHLLVGGMPQRVQRIPQINGPAGVQKKGEGGLVFLRKRQQMPDAVPDAFVGVHIKAEGNGTHDNS